MKIELIKTDGNTIGYNLVSENSDEQYALNTIRNLHYSASKKTQSVTTVTNPPLTGIS